MYTDDIETLACSGHWSLRHKNKSQFTKIYLFQFDFNILHKNLNVNCVDKRLLKFKITFKDLENLAYYFNKFCFIQLSCYELQCFTYTALHLHQGKYYLEAICNNFYLDLCHSFRA